jgi:hypothetical protein
MAGECDINLIERERQCLEHRATGATYEQIASAVGYASASGAYAALSRALKRTLIEPASQVRQIEINRLDAMHAALWPTVESPASDQLLLKAIPLLLKIAERRARLLGLDAPTELRQQIVEPVDHEREQRIRQVLADALDEKRRT